MSHAHSSPDKAAERSCSKRQERRDQRSIGGFSLSRTPTTAELSMLNLGSGVVKLQGMRGPASLRTSAALS